MAAVPLPCVPRPVGEEVRCALVLHTLGETQQHSQVIVSGLRGVGCAVGTWERLQWDWGTGTLPLATGAPSSLLPQRPWH